MVLVRDCEDAMTTKEIEVKAHFHLKSFRPRVSVGAVAWFADEKQWAAPLFVGDAVKKYVGELRLDGEGELVSWPTEAEVLIRAEGRIL